MDRRHKLNSPYFSFADFLPSCGNVSHAIRFWGWYFRRRNTLPAKNTNDTKKFLSVFGACPDMLLVGVFRGN